MQSAGSATTLRIYIFTFLLLLVLPFTGNGHSAAVGSDIERVSIATRSDGLGYVIRFHFKSAPLAFRLVQPEPGHIQVLFEHSGSKPDKERISVYDPFTEISFVPLPEGHGSDIRLDSDRSFIARAYHDQNRRDVLVGLTEVSESEIRMLTEGIPAIEWQSGLQASAELDTVSAGSSPPDEFPDEARDDDTISPAPINRSATTFNTIVLDPGHGGRDPGAIGANGSFEKNIALAVARKVGGYIEEYMPELNVIYTRQDDTFVGLAERGRLANKSEGHLFVSIHTNSHTGRQANGAEFYFLGIGRSSSALEVMRRENSVIRFEEGTDATEELTEQQLMIYEMQNIGNMAMSQHFAELLDYQFAQRAQRRSRGVKQAGLQVLYEASMPGVLVELGFISNPAEERFMNSDYGQSILASAIFRAIRDYRDNFNRAQRDRNSN